MDQRPVNLNLLNIKFPITAIVSICHRVSGVVLLISLPFWLWALESSLKSGADFAKLQDCFAHLSVKIAIWLSLSALSFHFFAGIRHMLMDMGYGESKCAGRFTARSVFLLTILLSIIIGYWLW